MPDQQLTAPSATQIDTKSAIKKHKLIQLWKDTRGNITEMCAAVKVQRNTFYSWLKKDPEFNKAIQDAEWGLHDEVRDALIQKIAEGSSSDIQFYLKKRHPDFMDKPRFIGVQSGDMKVVFEEYG